jgi:hypothetical protein
VRRRSLPLGRRVLAVAASLALLLAAAPTAVTQDDPRVGLTPGLDNAGEAGGNLELLAHLSKPDGFFNPFNAGDLSYANSDLAFSGDYAFVGSFHGFQVYDVSDPEAPELVTAYVCPGGQGDLSVYGDLLFMSVEETRAKTDCTVTPAATPLTRFRGVRIFDISDPTNPEQVALVQTCRGSHTHTLVTDPEDDSRVYVYVSGTAGVRSPEELVGCDNGGPSTANPSRWRIEVIEVPLDRPEQARVVNEVRLFREGDRIDGLQQQPPTPLHPSGSPWSPSPVTDACHDITAYPEIGLAAGACEGNGLLIDITDPANPVRVDAVADSNFTYWHSATFNNDGTKVVFTDEWGGGTVARCRPTDRPEWGANAIFDIVQTADGPRMEFASYYKLPVPQRNQENCVAHNGSLVPIPNRDVMVQAWYQGGVSVLDFTDSANPVEIAFFDRGPISGTGLVLGGLWSAYYWNGHVYGSEIARGFDVLRLLPSRYVSENELAAAATVRSDQLNAQLQEEQVWPATFTLVRANLDQVVRTGTLPANKLANVTKMIEKAEGWKDGPQRNAAKAQLRAAVNQFNTSVPSQANLAEALERLADSL